MAQSERGGTLRSGEILNNTYVIEELIGAGGTGEVYHARNRVSGREIAIKILRREFAGNENYVNLMRREAEVLHEVVDDAVVRYYDLLESDTHGGFVFLAMEFIRGESLADVMRRGPVNEATLLKVAARIAQGLRASHAKLAFHRDLSPDNVILRDGLPERAVIIDFGIAKDVNPDARTVVGSGFAGKYQYAAPEQMDGNVDGRSDLYSLGMTLIAAARGRTPEVGSSFLEVLRAKSRKPDISDLAPKLRALVDRLVEPDPAKRFQTAAEVLEFLGDAVPRAPTTIPPPGLVPPGGTAPRKARSGGGAVWLLVLLLLGGLGGGGWYLLLGPGRALVFPPEFPLADPYRLEIAVDGPGRMAVSGHAPSPEAAAALLSALSAINRNTTPTGRIEPATGVPGPGWQPGLVAIARALSVLSSWRLSASGTTVELFGEAPDQKTFDTILGAAETAAREGGLVLKQSLTLQLRALDLARLRTEANAFATCGPLEITGGDGTSVPPGGTITVAGAVSRDADRALIETALKDLVEGRPLALALGILNVPVCRVLGTLPGTTDPAFELRYTHGDKAGTVADSIYRLGENPVIDLLLPMDAAGDLHVFYVDLDGQVFHLLPHNARQDAAVARIGTVEDGKRRIRLTWPESEASVAQLGFRVVEPFGVNLVVAILTPAPLFADIRPRAESLDAFLPALAAARRANAAGERIAFRFLATRP